MEQTAAGLIPVPSEAVERRIYLIRGVKVMIDADIARLYRVTTSHLNLAVRRNTHRFPEDFMFRLTVDEVHALTLQTEISKISRAGGRRYLPYAFTEHGVAMLSAVLRSDRAVEMSILIMRVFVKLRELVASNQDLAARIEMLEVSRAEHASVINILAEEIDLLKLPPPAPSKRIGFRPD